ncbi:MAG: hypothetical protein NC340_06020 [Ruminococcus flavefaciens]|nr:hypothetical protein [Ruminococcus flavefaciens]MCM1231226.1 hypothetical protein [Ruminococcus flavefaciens]
MKHLKDVDGLDTLLEKLPDGYKSWYHFCRVLEFHFAKEFDYEDEFDYTSNIDMVLASYDGKYKIRMKLKAVSGLVSFDVCNGFCSGFCIEYSDCCEKERRYKLSSYEQDIYFEFYCKKISVELID